MCAFSDCPVGVDLQQRTKIRRSVLQKFYLQEQLEAWKKQFDKKEEVFLSEAETERFLREWTVKESYVKLTRNRAFERFACADGRLEPKQGRGSRPARLGIEVL